MLALMPDIHRDQIEIKCYASFPETDTKDLFCDKCKQHVLSQNDFRQDKDYLRKTLSIPAQEPILNENQPLMQKICSRLIGNETNEFPPKQLNSYFLSYVKTVDNLIFLDHIQQNVLKTLDEDPSKKNFSFTGPPGTGKTIVAIKCCNKLIQKYLDCETVEKVYVYAIVFNETENMELIKTFQRNIHDRSMKITVNCMTLSDLKKEANCKVNIFNGTKEMIQALVLYLETKHSPHPCVILFDEAQLGNLEKVFFWKRNWSNLSSKRNTHLILCFSPMNRHFGEYFNVELDSSFYTKTFKIRYRNSQRIQQLAINLPKMEGLLVRKSLTLEENEENVPCLQGPPILWIDVGDNFHCISKAVEMLKNKSKYPKEENILLHDNLSDDIFTKVEAAWPSHGTRKNVKEFIGCECDSVIHISTGAGTSFVLKSYENSLFVFVIFVLIVVLFRTVLQGGVADCVGVDGVVGSDWGLLVNEVVSGFCVGCFVGFVVGAATGISVCFFGHVGGGVFGVNVFVFVVYYLIDVSGSVGVGGAVVIVISAVGYFFGCAFGYFGGCFAAGAVDLGYNEEAITRARYFTGIITINKETGYKKLTEKLR